MTTTVGTLIDSIGRRVRDANNTAHSRAFVRDIIDRSQVLINAKQEYVFTETIYTATKGKTLYSVEEDLGSSTKVVEVSIGDRELDKVGWRNLHRLSPTWLTDESDTPLAWAPIGRSLVAVYPAPDYDLPITFTASKRTTPLTDDTIQMELRDEDSDIVRELATAILLIRQRDLDMVPIIISRLAGKLGLQTEEQMDRQEGNGE